MSEKTKIAICITAIVAVVLVGIYQTMNLNSERAYNQQLNTDIASKNIKLQELNITLSYARQQIADLDNKAKTLEDALTTKDSESEGLKDNLTTIRETLSLKNAMITDLKNQISQLTFKVAEKDMEISKFQATFEGLKSQINDLKLKIESLKQELTNAETETNQLMNEIEQLRKADVRPHLTTEFHGRFWFWEAEYSIVKGTVTNYGTEKANNIVITLQWSKSGKVYHEEYYKIKDLDGRSTIQIETTYTFDGKEDLFAWTVVYNTQ